MQYIFHMNQAASRRREEKYRENADPSKHERGQIHRIRDVQFCQDTSKQCPYHYFDKRFLPDQSISSSNKSAKIIVKTIIG